MRLAGKVALVTGAGQGLGEAMAVRFARDGADVMCNDLNAETAAQTAAQVRALGRKAASFAGSVLDESVVQALVEATVKELGGLDILVNNAAANPYYGPTLEVDQPRFD